MKAGDKLGPYEILSAIGAGGMGEVYKARDTRLDRTVAVKVLPDHVSERAEVRARFEREARAVASLNHPNICSLFDIGPGYMVMELIEGETLAARIEKGALPLEQALKFAGQIADALDRAHRAGVTHRDVKPQNIMITRDGVKVLDFGLAKSVTKPSPTSETLTKGITTEGTVLGTPQYMAPEQFEGCEADARSDIWSFGAVLYEMVTGKKAFLGKNYSSLVGAILSADPAPMSVASFTPSWLERLVRRCLAKDPDERYQSMRDLVIDLRSPPQATVEAKAGWSPWIVAAAVVFGVLIGGWSMSRTTRQGAAPEQAQRFQLLPPEGGKFDRSSGPALSPDGRTLAVVGAAPGKSGVWIRPMDGTAAQLLPGTQGASLPFWSPDSRFLAYWASGKLWRVDVSGGSPMAICEAFNFRGGSWSPDGTIVFGVQTSGLSRVAASGGTPEVLTKLDAARGETSHRWPQVLPDGRILFFLMGKPGEAGIYAISAAKPEERVRLMATIGPALYSAGHLLWRHGTTLMAQGFDAARLQLSGEARPIADPVGLGSLGGMAVSSSSSGLLVYWPAVVDQLSWVDRTGQASDTDKSSLGEPGDYITFRVSHDGRRVAIGKASVGGRDLWLADVERDAWSRFTFLPGVAVFPVWSPDGSHVIFSSGPLLNLYRKQASGAGSEQRVTESSNQQWANDWSRDGRILLYDELAPVTQRDLWLMPVRTDGSLEAGGGRPYLRTSFNESQGRFSPEPSPRWVAYTSDESGRSEVYAQSFPEPRGKFLISKGGGQFPEWSADGRQLYYVSADGKLMSADVKLGSDSVVTSMPRELFALPTTLRIFQSYAVAPDGKRILVLTSAGGAQTLEVVVNWQGLLRKGGAQE